MVSVSTTVSCANRMSSCWIYTIGGDDYGDDDVDDVDDDEDDEDDEEDEDEDDDDDRGEK